VQPGGVEMRLMSIKLLVLSTALMLLLTACTAAIPTPTPDAEATLVARVAATIVAISSLTPAPVHIGAFGIPTIMLCLHVRLTYFLTTLDYGNLPMLKV